MPFALVSFASELPPTQNIYENPYDQIAIEDDTVINLHQFGLGVDTLKDKVKNMSPFCQKLEAYLRFAGVPYKVVEEARAKNAPRGKLPFVDVDGVNLADGGLIVGFLKRHYRDIDAGLTPMQVAQGRMLSAMLQNELYWMTLYYEFVDDESSAYLMKASYGFDEPSEFSVSLRADFFHRMWAHGMGRYTVPEMLQIARDDIDALATFLGDNEHVLGTPEPTSFDAVVFGMTVLFFQVRDMHPEVTDYIRSKRNLANYMGRLITRYFPELKPDFEYGASTQSSQARVTVP
jgi:glutathione S-transferase